MLAGWKMLVTQNNSLTLDLLKEDLDNHSRDYYMDAVIRPKHVIYWPFFLTRRR
jgi:hypothetical protein